MYNRRTSSIRFLQELADAEMWIFEMINIHILTLMS